MLRNKTAENVFASNTLSCLVRRSVCFSSIVNISTNTYGTMSCISERPKHAESYVVPGAGSVGCVGKIGSAVERGDLVGVSLVFSGCPGRLVPFSFSTCFRSRVRYRLMAAGYLAKGTRCVARARSPSQLVGVYHTSDDVPLIAPVIGVSNIPCLSNKLTSSIPVHHTRGLKGRGVVIVLAEGRNCHGGIVSPTIRGLCERTCGSCPGTIQAVFEEDFVCGGAVGCLSRLRGHKRVCILHPRMGPMSQLRRRPSILRTFCRRKCRLVRQGARRVLGCLRRWWGWVSLLGRREGKD